MPWRAYARYTRWMALKDLFRGFSKSRDDQALARAERESHMSAHDREVDSEDYEARKDDLSIGAIVPRRRSGRSRRATTCP